MGHSGVGIQLVGSVVGLLPMVSRIMVAVLLGGKSRGHQTDTQYQGEQQRHRAPKTNFTVHGIPPLTTSGQQAGQQGHQNHTDEGNAAARHELLDALGLGGGVVLAVTFQKVDAAPHAQAAAQRDNQSLQNLNRLCEEIHRSILLSFV